MMKNHFFILSIILMLIACCSYLKADTVYFKDGSNLDGTASEEGDMLVLRMGSGSMSFQKDKVDRVEKNDKTGDSTQMAIQLGKQHEDALKERTGLTREQRDIVRDAMEPLWSEDEGERNAGKQQLLKLAKQMPIAKFIAESLPYSKGYVVPELMEVLAQIAPKESQETLLGRTMDIDPRNRAKAIELLGKTKNAEAIGEIARGMVDLEPDVNVATAHSLSDLGDKRATPVLLEGLKNPDQRVQNASMEALSKIWSAQGKKVSFKTPGEWRSFWDSQSSSVKNSIKLNDLQPLVTKEQLETATHGHDE